MKKKEFSRKVFFVCNTFKAVKEVWDTCKMNFVKWTDNAGNSHPAKSAAAIYARNNYSEGCRSSFKGWERNFVLKKFRGIDSERFRYSEEENVHSVWGIPRSTEESIPKLGTERNSAKQMNFSKQSNSQNNLKGQCYEKFRFMFFT